MHVLPSSVCSSSPAGRADWREAPGLGTWLRCEDTWTVRNKCWLGKLRPGRGGDLRLLGLRCLQSPVAGGRGLSSCPPPPRHHGALSPPSPDRQRGPSADPGSCRSSVGLCPLQRDPGWVGPRKAGAVHRLGHGKRQHERWLRNTQDGT